MNAVPVPQVAHAQEFCTPAERFRRGTAALRAAQSYDHAVMSTVAQPPSYLRVRTSIGLPSAVPGQPPFDFPYRLHHLLGQRFEVLSKLRP